MNMLYIFYLFLLGVPGSYLGYRYYGFASNVNSKTRAIIESVAVAIGVTLTLAMLSDLSGLRSWVV